MSEQLTFEDTDDLFELKRAWDTVLRRLGPEVPSAWMERFLRPLSPLGMEGGIVRVAVPGKFVLEWVRKRFLDTLTQMLSDEIGTNIVIELETEANERAAVTTTPSTSHSPVVIRPEPVTAFRPSEKFAFENYVVGQSNRLAFAGAKAVAAEPGQKFNPLFIYGSSGLGKTHLLHAIAREILKKDQRYPLAYVSAQQFAEDFINALQANKVDQFRRLQRSVGVWLVDDIQFIAGKDKTQEEIFHTFNYLHSLGKQIVLTSDRPPRDLYLMDERLRSRFEAGLVADIQMPDTETRCAIIQSKATQERIGLAHEVAMFLAENVPGNIRVLEGALTKLVAQASVEDRPVDLELAQMLVEKYYRAGALAKPAFGQIVDTVSKHFKISTDEIKGTSRKAPIVHARHVAVYITREITGDSWKHIGGLFGDRDHTSMMHGYQKIQEIMQYDRDLRATVKMLMRNLYPDS
ncbi:MAG TPA: chromosomal replication initiator protein DnaA [Fimbriimonas sp.]|nr:chromosomal replication initiator protein DnaA [Fimbriimonas sp.]